MYNKLAYDCCITNPLQYLQNSNFRRNQYPHSAQFANVSQTIPFVSFKISRFKRKETSEDMPQICIIGEGIPT